MKKLILLLFVGMLVVISCDVYPQNISVKTTYNTPAGADSCYMIVWKGSDTQNCPLQEDGDFEMLSLTGLLVYKIPVGEGQSFTTQMLANGQTFKIALVPFDYNIAAPLTVSAFYILPTPPNKATIINVEIF